jgi:hypothetical protein
MTEQILTYPSVRETIQKFNMYGKANGSLPIELKKDNTHVSSLSISSTSRLIVTENDSNSNEIQQQRYSISSKSTTNDENIGSVRTPVYASPTVANKDPQKSRSNSMHNNLDDIGLGIIEPIETQRQKNNNDEIHESLKPVPSTIADYGEHDIPQQVRDLYPPISPRLPPPLPPVFALPNLQDESNSPRKRTLPLSIFLLEIGALVVMFILSMVLVLAIREEQANLRTTMQVFIFFFIK